MPLEWFVFFIQLVSAAKANPDAAWAVALLDMWNVHNHLVDKEWCIRLRRAGLEVPTVEADRRFHGIFTAPLVGAFLGCHERFGTERASRMLQHVLPELISEHPVDEAFLRWLLENPIPEMPE